MKNLRRIRAERQITLRDLEEMSGVSKETISGIERGSRSPQPLTLGKLAKALDVDVDDLLSETPRPKASAPLSSLFDEEFNEAQWCEHVDTLSREELEALTGALRPRVEELTTGLDRADLADPVHTEASLRAMQELLLLQRRLLVLERALAKSRQ